jgi:hypothetical protein
MKRSFVSLLLLSSFVSVSAFAAEEVEFPKLDKCTQSLKLSAEQKAEIKKIEADSKEALKLLSNELKKAKDDAKKVLLKADATKAEAVAAKLVLSDKFKEVQEIKEADKLSVLFDVLSAEQRVKKLKCEADSQHGRRQHARQGRAVRQPTRVGQHPAPSYRPSRTVRIGRPSQFPAPYHRQTIPQYGRRHGRVYP